MCLAPTTCQHWDFPGDSAVKSLPAMQETWVQSMGWSDPWEESMATHSSTLTWRISWTEESGGLQSTESQSGMTERLTLITYLLTGIKGDT